MCGVCGVHVVVAPPCAVTWGAQANQTEGDICGMGARLANEVHKFVQEKITGEGLHLHALSFVGFSLG